MLLSSRWDLDADIWVANMRTSLFIEHHANGLAFYINGDLQFDTADEALYHEYLVIPAITLVVERFPQTNLRVLICGGGDGLAARDVLRFPQIEHIDLVDYNPEVLELAQTVFKPFNSGSLASDRLTAYTQDAFEFVSTIPDNSYHIVICDFTYPTRPEETSIYSREWFQQINRVLTPSGIISTNGVSPENRTLGFWCLYQTLLSAGFKAKPLQLDIPSFRRHGYGNWGFFLASGLPIEKSELEGIKLPDDLQALTGEQLLKSFIFPDGIANIRHDVIIHTLDCPQLFYYLLNPKFESTNINEVDTTVDFLDIDESGTALFAARNWLELESMVRIWLEQIYQSQSDPEANPDIGQLVPVQHRYHSPKMTREWLAYLKQLLAEIDLSRLVNSLLERAQELPPQIASDLKQLAEQLKTGKPLPNLPPRVTEFVMMLSVTLLMANLVTPDTVFAKGSYSSGSSGYSSGSTTYSTLDSDYVGDDSGFTKIWGFMFTTMGVFWLVSIFNRSRNE
jgi:spermidine synthase